MKNRIIAALLWDTNNRSISYMIINNRYQVLVSPQKHNLGPQGFAAFARQAAEVIDTFFEKVIAASREEDNCPILIEYKIVHPISHALVTFYQPSPRSDFVRKQFLSCYEKIKKTHQDIVLSQQLRSRLRRPELDRFKNTLKKLQHC